MEESFARKYGGRWRVGLAGDEPAQRDAVEGDVDVSVEGQSALDDRLASDASLGDDDDREVGS
jgi:hypothetical protein